MADKILKTKIQQRYDTEANWKSMNPVLLKGEMAFSSDKNGKYKIGDGTSTWSAIGYAKANTDDIKVGARNLARNTNISKTWQSKTSYANDTWTNIDGGTGWLPSIPIESNTEYTLSFDYVLQNATDDVGVGIGASSDGKYYSKDLWNSQALFKTYGSSITSGHFVYHLAKKTLDSKMYFAFRPLRRTGSTALTTSINLTISNFKLEKGNMATDWTAAPEDKSDTSHTHDLSTMINTLSTATAAPTDTDYYVSQYVGGGTTTTTYHRRPMSALWSYIKGKGDSVYQAKGSYAASSHTHDDRYYTETEINTKLGGYLPLSGGTMTGNIKYTEKGQSYIGNGANDACAEVGGGLNNLVISSWNGVSFTTSCESQTYTNKSAVSIDCRNSIVKAATFKGALSGNASTASSAAKLTTARTVSGGTDIAMSFSYDGSANSSASVGFYNCSVSNGNKNNYPYHRFAKLDTITKSYSDRTMTVYLTQDYNGGAFGVARISLRTNNSSTVSSAEVKWLVRSGFSTDAIQIGIYEVYGQTYADAFLKLPGQYAGTVVRAFASGQRGSIARTWTLISSKEVDDTTTTDALKSTESYVDISTAGTKLHNKAYSRIVNGQDAGTVLYASTAPWSGISNKPSITSKTIKSLSSISNAGWSNLSSAQSYVPDMSFITYWNGAYSGTTSNLAYCNKGAFGTIVTKNINDYALASHTHNISDITNLQSTLDSKANKTIQTSATSYIIPNSTSIEASPFARDFWHDHFAFLKSYTIESNQVSTDGTTWKDDSLNLYPLFIQKEATKTVLLSEDIVSRRFILKGCQYSTVSWIEIGVLWASTFSNFELIIEKSNDMSTWSVINTSNVENQAIPIFIGFDAIQKFNYIRFTFTKKTNITNGTVPISCIKGYTSRKGDQGLGIEYEYPYDWDSNGHIFPLSNNSNNLGSSSKRWRNVYATSFNGNATSADKLNVDKGSATQPVYFSGGKPVACAYTLGKSVPSDAKFTDTNTTYPFYNKTIDTDFSTKFRTETKGNTSSGDYIATIRNNTASVTNSPQHGAGIAFGRQDTHGYIYYNYNNAAMYVGAGNADKLNWVKQVSFTDHNHDSAYLKLNGGTISGNLTATGDLTANNLYASENITLSTAYNNIVQKVALSVADNGRLLIDNGTSISGSTSIYGDLSVTESIEIKKAINCEGSITVTDESTFGDSINVNGAVRFIDYASEAAGSGNKRRPVSSVPGDGLRIGWVKSKTASNGKKQFCVNGQWGTEDSVGNPTSKGEWTTGYILIDSTSDVRLKKNIKNTDISALPIINSMKVRQFDWKETGTHQQLGLIADELDEFDPLLTVGGGYESDGSMYVKQIDRLLLTEYAIKGIQEQQNEIADLQKKNKTLLLSIANLEKELANLKKIITNK